MVNIFVSQLMLLVKLRSLLALTRVQEVSLKFEFFFLKIINFYNLTAMGAMKQFDSSKQLHDFQVARRLQSEKNQSMRLSVSSFLQQHSFVLNSNMTFYL